MLKKRARDPFQPCAPAASSARLPRHRPTQWHDRVCRATRRGAGQGSHDAARVGVQRAKKARFFD